MTRRSALARVAANSPLVGKFTNCLLASKPCPESECGFAPLVREPLSSEAATRLAVTLKALADPVRLRLMSLIASHDGGEACVCDVSVGIALSQPTISDHLKVLRTAGLLSAQRRGSWVYYRVIPDALQQLSQLLGTDALATATEPR